MTILALLGAAARRAVTRPSAWALLLASPLYLYLYWTLFTYLPGSGGRVAERTVLQAVFLAGLLGTASALVVCHEHDWLHAQVSRTTRWISEFSILAFGSAIFAALALFGATAIGLPSGISLPAIASACMHWAAIGLVISSLPTAGWAQPALLAGLGWVLPALLAGTSPVQRTLAGLLDASRHLHLESHAAATRMANPVDMAPIGALALGSWLMRRRSDSTR